jgi:hypothetical protein
VRRKLEELYDRLLGIKSESKSLQLRGRSTALSSFFEDYVTAKASLQELFAAERRETDEGLGRTPTPDPYPTPAPEPFTVSDAAHASNTTNNNRDSDDPSSGNYGSGPTGPDSVGSDGDNSSSNFRTAIVISYLGNFLSQIIDVLNSIYF